MDIKIPEFFNALLYPKYIDLQNTLTVTSAFGTFSLKSSDKFYNYREICLGDYCIQIFVWGGISSDLQLEI